MHFIKVIEVCPTIVWSIVPIIARKSWHKIMISSIFFAETLKWCYFVLGYYVLMKCLIGFQGLCFQLWRNRTPCLLQRRLRNGEMESYVTDVELHLPLLTGRYEIHSFIHSFIHLFTCSFFYSFSLSIIHLNHSFNNLHNLCCWRNNA